MSLLEVAVALLNVVQLHMGEEGTRQSRMGGQVSDTVSLLQHRPAIEHLERVKCSDGEGEVPLRLGSFSS